MIVDGDGNITELIPMPNTREAPYVDKIYTIEPNGSLISYQYAPANHFSIGFAHLTADSTGFKQTVATTRDRRLRLEICIAYSIGGIRDTVQSREFSTNLEDAEQYGKCYTTAGGGPAIQLVHEGDLSGVYYNGKITNLSSESTNVRVQIYSA